MYNINVVLTNTDGTIKEQQSFTIKDHTVAITFMEIMNDDPDIHATCPELQEEAKTSSSSGKTSG